MADKKKKEQKRFIKKRSIIAALLIALMWCFTIEPNVVVVNKYKVKDESLKGIKIVMAGDFHVKPYQAKRLDYVVEKINAQNPDVVLLVGDYVNMHSDYMSYPIAKTAEKLSKIYARAGIYTVLGNHDYYKEGKKIKQALEEKGITVLENRCRKIDVGGKTFYIAGIEDLVTAFPNVDRALKFAKEPTILLSHQPDVFPYLNNDKIHLTLSGHTHGGQVVIPFVGPLIVPSRFGTKYASGYFEEKGNKMIVTKGIGTSIMPIRFNCMPEIVVIEFE
ncbi:MAG: metallophosphoesterase [Candidatus Gastranaerophilales bacterium]|nr:metallophosphoesterase [Candidatus Gastranaerophilales bacterium]